MDTTLIDSRIFFPPTIPSDRCAHTAMDTALIMADTLPSEWLAPSSSSRVPCALSPDTHAHVGRTRKPRFCANTPTVLVILIDFHSTP